MCGHLHGPSSWVLTIAELANGYCKSNHLSVAKIFYCASFTVEELTFLPGFLLPKGVGTLMQS